MTFACLRGHTIEARSEDGEPLDLNGYFCPVCLGRVIGYENMIDSRILAPRQEAPC